VGEDTRSWLRAYQERGFLDVPEELLTEDPTEPNAMLLVGALAGDVLDPFIELAYRRHPSVQLVEGDTIVITAKPPVGTTRLLANAVDQLYVLGVQVIGGRDAGVHVEGHAAQEELKFLYNLTRPRNFLPAHGEVRQLILHAELQGKCGLQPNNIIIIDNGHAVDFSASKGTMGVSGQVPARPIYFSQRFSGNLNVESVEERYTLGEDGTLVTVIGLNKDNSKIISGPIVRGLGSALIESRDWPEVERNICQDIVKVVAKALEAGQSDNGQLRRLVHDVLNKRIREKFGMTNPIHSIVIQRQK
jgi:ribonuclease J